MNGLQEAACYHDPQRRGFFSLLVNGKQGSYRLSQMETVLDALPTNADIWLGQAEFNRPNRRVVNLARVGLCFADCETHKSHYAHLSPEQQVQALLMHCEDTGAPRPSSINFSGRGLHVKWLFDAPLPGQALPRWNAVQKGLIDGLKDFAPDRAARDGSRCLRAVGTVNSRSGQMARNVWTDETGGKVAAWDFETICREVLPIERAELQKKRAESSAKRAGKCNLWQPKQLWWNRFQDVRHLIELRGWTEGVPQGQRHNFLFIAACAVAWSAEPASLPAEISELAREFCPSLPAQEVRSLTAGTLARVQTATRLKFSNLRLIEWLDIQPDEQKHLRTICDPDERKRRKQKHDRENARKFSDRETYERDAAARRQQAQTLRADGLSYAAIAASMGLTTKQVDNLLNRPVPSTP